MMPNTIIKPTASCIKWAYEVNKESDNKHNTTATAFSNVLTMYQILQS